MIMNTGETSRTVPALPLRLQDLIDEYDAKIAEAEILVESHDAFIKQVHAASSIRGEYAGPVFSYHPSLCTEDVCKNLLKSAWRHVYKLCKIEEVAPASDRQKFERELENPPDFTYDNVKATFRDYLADPRYHILRGLAEVFTALDPAFRSHSRVKVGVNGLPKRVIITRYDPFSSDKLRDVITAIAAYRGRIKPNNHLITKILRGEIDKWEGLSFKLFRNHNIHIHFDKPSLEEINKALNEFYGEGLFDASVDESKPDKQKASTAPSKDLAYYPTPVELAEKINQRYIPKGAAGKLLEPSCGCGRLLDVVPDSLKAYGIEIDSERAATARSKGHAVQTGNFLEQSPTGDFDFVFMNPPFAGLHWAKHILHAAEFLKPGGKLVSILPASAWYDHLNKLPANELRCATPWRDLPVGSFSQSGSNICTGVFEYIKPLIPHA